MKICNASASDILILIQQQQKNASDPQECHLAPIEKCPTRRPSGWCKNCPTLLEILEHPDLELPDRFGQTDEITKEALEDIEGEPAQLVNIFKKMIQTVANEFSDKNIEDLEESDRKLVFACKLFQEFLLDKSDWLEKIFEGEKFLTKEE